VARPSTPARAQFASAPTPLPPGLRASHSSIYDRVFIEAGPALAPVLRQAAAQGIAPAMVGRLLLDDRTMSPDHWPFAVPSLGANMSTGKTIGFAVAAGRTHL
jgi:hypothetical protein